jgi:hypothetical protein
LGETAWRKFSFLLKPKTNESDFNLILALYEDHPDSGIIEQLTDILSHFFDFDPVKLTDGLGVLLNLQSFLQCQCSWHRGLLMLFL